jgi:hypothetical protein
VKPKKYYLRKREIVEVGELMEYNRTGKLAQRISYAPMKLPQLNPLILLM